MSYILTIDQGTSSSRAVIYNQNFEVVSIGQHQFSQYYPKPSWVEHDLNEIWQSVEDSIRDAIKGCKDKAFSMSKIKAIGITNQRETFGLWNKKTSKPVSNAIVWQCRRSSELCKKLSKSKQGKTLCDLSGLVLDPYFSGTKLKWLLDSKKQIRAQAEKGELAFGTIDTFLLWKLTNKKSHATDVSNASRTMLMDLKSCEWSEQALKILDIPKTILPVINDSDSSFGVTENVGVLPDGIPICGILGDQQSALFGQACIDEGQSKVTYGTGAFLLMNTGSRIKKTKGALSTVAWTCGGKTRYALEASVFISGAAVQWLRDNLKIIDKAPDIEKLAVDAKSSEGVFMVPAFSGLGSPYWNAEARAMIGGLTRGSKQGHVAYACLEGMAQSVADVFELLAKSFKGKKLIINVDGGASMNNLLMQIQSDLCQAKINRPFDIESTARGAAFMAALGSGLVKSEKSFVKLMKVAKKFNPKKKADWSKGQRKLWKKRIVALEMMS